MEFKDGGPVREKSFSTRDPLFESVSNRLELNPEKQKEISRLFNTPLNQHKEQIIAFRSGDVLTTIDQLLQGQIVLNYRGVQQKGIMGKAEGWFYLTPVLDAEVLKQKHQDLYREDVPVMTFQAALNHNTEAYSTTLAFNTAFTRNVLPLLGGNGPADARKILSAEKIGSPLPKGADEGDLYERLTHEFQMLVERKEFQNHKVSEIMNSSLGKGIPALSELAGLFPEGQVIPVLQFLKKAARERGGVIIGFNERILQGKVISPANAKQAVLHDDKEIAIRPKNGVIDLSDNPIVGIEALGLYEDEILDKLQLQKPN